MASKPSTKSGKTANSLPQELVSDIEKVLKKHKFKVAVAIKAKATADAPCPDGRTLKTVSVKKSDGSIVTELRCVKNNN
jgi:hypothetical protein